MRSRILGWLFLPMLLSACGERPTLHPAPRVGTWLMHLELGEAELPFQFDVLERDSGGWHMRIHNAAEEIDVSEIESRGDSLFVRMPLFDSEFQARMLNDTIIEGVWCNLLKGPEYRIPFRAWHTAAQRFDHEAPRAHVSGSWRSVFSAGAPEAYEAIGIFEQFDDGRVHGTFMTETGDYRFLEGAVSGDSLMLSAFDGSHAFLFHARVLGDSMAGRFWSGTHWQEPWHAARDEQFRLRDPDSLTALQPGTQAIAFTFPDLDGHPWSSTDPDLKGLPLIVHVMGSWCPNCVDETRLLKEMHQKYHSRGLRIVAIGFEKQQDSTAAIAALRRFKERLDVPYPVLLGGPAAKEQAAARLPFLNHLISYPTCIFIDRAGHVRRIRTGFNGPGTGEHYATYQADLESFLDTLVMR